MFWGRGVLDSFMNKIQQDILKLDIPFLYYLRQSKQTYYKVIIHFFYYIYR